ncbi:MAG TPA: DUF2846 domain-containing protein [Terracidiphilus sp.]|nr:DUF2846 domain-containing protein [Terracidiphilus sp.]
MKIALLLVLCAASALAQNPSVNPLAACGSDGASFKTKMDDSRHTVDQPESGKARIYFIHESGTPLSLGYPTTKLGVDGKWVGANHSNSYFSVSVEPGEHHLCAALQSSLVGSRVELAHFQAEAGKVYFYRTRLVMSRSIELLDLEPLDSDQGRYLVDSFPLSISTRK